MRFTPRSFATVAVATGLVALSSVNLGARAAEAPSRSPQSSRSEAQSLKPTTEELRFVELTNQERAKQGLRRLEIEPALIAVARKHSAEMRDKDYFGHESPTEGIKTPLDRFLQEVSQTGRPVYACVGENLFYCSTVDVQRGHKALMNSPTHRENILFPRFEKMGVGIVKDERGQFWVTQMFLATTDPHIHANNRMSKK